MITYFLHDGRNEIGPFTIDNLKNQKLTRNTPIRQEGKDSWAPAEKLAELKDIVAPKKIRRPKDIVPVMMERVIDFKKRKPKTLYGILFCIALVAGVSIYSIQKSVTTSKPVTRVFSVPVEVTETSLTASGVADAKKPEVVIPKVDNEKAARLRWNKLITANNSSYGIGLLGGIKNLKVFVTNRSDYPIDQAIVKVSYIKANGGVWKTKLITIHGIPAQDTKEQSVPDVGRGKKVTVSIQKLISKKMRFSYTAGKKITDTKDPYLMQ